MTAAEFERLARAHRPALLALARRRGATYEDAEDIVQQALANAFEVRERIRAPTGLAYLGAVARNEALRHGRHVKPLSLDQPVPGTNTASVYEILADPRRRDVDGELDVLAGLRAAKPHHARPDRPHARLALPRDLRRVRLDLHQDRPLPERGARGITCGERCVSGIALRRVATSAGPGRSALGIEPPAKEHAPAPPVERVMK
jgi:DNA-directed RNA polymerase specialized sigma24 family protein